MTELQEFWNAIRGGESEKVLAFLEKKPRLLDQVNEEGVSPIVFAAYQGHMELAERLADRKVVLNVFEAAVCGRVSTLVHLLARDPGLVDAYQGDGFQPLGLACYFRRFEVVKYLLRAGAPVNSPSRNALKASPLHSAVAARDAEIVRLLLSHDADPNIRENGGYTPTHLAAQNGDVEILRLLIFYGADTELKTDDGKTPLDLAQEASHAEAVELLKSGITKRLRRNFSIT